MQSADIAVCNRFSADSLRLFPNLLATAKVSALDCVSTGTLPSPFEPYSNWGDEVGSAGIETVVSQLLSCCFRDASEIFVRCTSTKKQ